MSLLRIPAEVLNLSRRIDAAAGDVLADTGDGGTEIYVIESGLLQIDGPGTAGSNPIRVAGPGDVAGEDALLNGPNGQRYQALTPVSLLGVSVFDVNTNLGVCKWLLAQMTAQWQQTGREIQWMRTHSVEKRVNLHLLSLHHKTGGSEIPISQADFAHIVGATRETISTALNKLARAEVVRISRRSITVLRPEGLGMQRGASA